MSEQVYFGGSADVDEAEMTAREMRWLGVCLSAKVGMVCVGAISAPSPSVCPS